MLPGQAKLKKRGGTLSLIVCDKPGNVPLGAVDFAGESILHQVEMAGGVVLVMELVLRLRLIAGERTYRAFVNELEECVVESLATMQEITVLLDSPKGETFARSTLANPFQAIVNESLGVISELAAKPWNGAQFAVAVKYLLAKDN
jgi:hypothetical protein